MPTWTFITNHGPVLALIALHKQITAREVASCLGITERSVLRIIAELETEGYLERKKEGRLNWYLVHKDKTLRRPELTNVPVERLLALLTPGLAEASKGLEERRARERQAR